MTATLDDLQIRSLLRADMPLNTQRYEDGELANLINNSASELYDMLVATEGYDRFLDAYEFATVAGQSSYDLPVNFYKSVGIDLNKDKAVSGNKYYTLLQYNHSDRMLYQNATDFFVDSKPRHRYRIIRGHLDILPAPEGVHHCQLHYIPQFTRLVNTSDKLQNEIVDSWAEYIEIDVAIKLLEKDEEFDRAQMLMQAKGVIAQRIQSSVGRDLEVPEVEPDSDNTLFNLRIQARYKANMVKQGSKSNNIVSDRELTHYINLGLEELYDKIVKAYDANYFLDAYQFTTEADKLDYNLPTDFYKMGGIDVVISGESYSLPNYNFAERNYYVSSSNWGAPTMHFQIQANSIRIQPAPDAGYSMTIWYTKVPPKLTNDTDAVENTIIRGWLDYAVNCAAIMMLNKALLVADPAKLNPVQTVIQNLMAQKAEMGVRLETMIENRNWGQPEKMVNADNITWMADY